MALQLGVLEIFLLLGFLCMKIVAYAYLLKKNINKIINTFNDIGELYLLDRSK